MSGSRKIYVGKLGVSENLKSHFICIQMSCHKFSATNLNMSYQQRGLLN